MTVRWRGEHRESERTRAPAFQTPAFQTPAFQTPAFQTLAACGPLAAAIIIGAFALTGCGRILGIDDGVPQGAGAADAGIDAAFDVCSLPTGVACDPVAQDCDPGLKCSVRFDPDMLNGRTECVPEGRAAIGAQCAFSDDQCSSVASEYDDCEEGSYCSSGTCQAICVSASAPCPNPDDQTCTQIAGVFEGGGEVGVCRDQCDPNEPPTCAAAEGCYPINFEGPMGFTEFDYICAVVPDEAMALVAGDDCAPSLPGGACFVNSAPAGAMILPVDMTGSRPAVVAPFCRPTNTSINESPTAANGVNGAVDSLNDTIECAAGNLDSGGFFAGAPRFGCRDLGSAFGDLNTNRPTDDPATYIGMCVPQSGGPLGATMWNESTSWNPQDLVDDLADGTLDDPNNLCFGCLDHATFDDLLERAPQALPATSTASTSLGAAPTMRVYEPRRRRR